jgi:transposase
VTSCRRSGCRRLERERARWRLYLVRQWSSLKHRIDAQLLAFGHTCPVSDLFGRKGRELLARLDFPDPWRSGVLAAVSMIDDLEAQIIEIDRELKTLGVDHLYIPTLMTAPGIAWVLGYTIAAEIGHIHPVQLTRKAVRLHRGCVRASTSPATPIAAATSRTRARSICGGR